ncbi:MAG TPA: GspH/FimT family pseudopilin [Longimicrobium sp.]|nr:GspH/FimT family pseudopilin [Longimicrobium sp.]
MHSAPRGRGGFSLAELLVVLVIMGIAVAMAVPRIQGAVKVSSVQGALNRVAGDLNYARVRAIRSGTRARLTISADGKSYAVVVDPGAAGGESRTVSLRVDYPDLVLSPTAGAVTFDSRGMLVTGGTNVVRATRQGRTDSLTVSGVGMIYREF